MDLEKINKIIEDELTFTAAAGFEANPYRAVPVAVRLGCAAVALLADIAGSLRRIVALFEEEAGADQRRA